MKAFFSRLKERLMKRKEVVATLGVVVGIAVTLQIFVASFQQLRVGRVVYSLLAFVAGIILKYVFKYDAL